jgi:Anti-sigma-K factor rskA, C-terminal
MNPEDPRSSYLETGEGNVPDKDQLDLVRLKLAEDETWADPPRSVLDEVLTAIDIESSGQQVAAASPGSKRRWAVVAVSLAAVAVLALVFVSLPGLLGQDSSSVVAMSGTDIEPGATGTATLESTSGGWLIRLDVEGLPPATPGTYYEGWVWNDNGEGVSIGTFHLRGGDQPVTLWSGVDLGEYPSIWVTLQDEGGGAEASDQVVMRGKWDQADA